MAEALHIPLKFPFTTAAGVYLDKLPIHRPKRKDIAAGQRQAKNDAELEDYLAAKMTGLTLEDLGELDIADSQTVTAVFREMASGGDGSEQLGRSAAPGAENAAE
ncbi:phage tail assembly protein [Pseudomonas sichuanensis]|uniref:phage tail assembly protein n=1 Tax=Pseudomonas sichuanensis TaxID=2213015 RepID=UPI00215FF773|nr:phage tail assembly protein [Pseudomonas sichuanensis]UVK85235.1 phage tail assembly protein [Pseudomonas sichuanensis]